MLCECPELLDKTSRIVVFDHHRKTSGAIENYSLTYHEAYASSTSEMVTLAPEDEDMIEVEEPVE